MGLPQRKPVGQTNLVGSAVRPEVVGWRIVLSHYTQIVLYVFMHFAYDFIINIYIVFC